jgi:hypothetical protein
MGPTVARTVRATYRLLPGADAPEDYLWRFISYPQVNWTLPDQDLVARVHTYVCVAALDKTPERIGGRMR